VFTCLNGDPMAPDRLSRTFRRLSGEAGLPPVRLHDLRRGAATLALAAVADLKVVQDMLGHSSIVLTADTYTSVLPEVAHKVAEDVATLIIQAGCLVPGTAGHASPSRPATVTEARDLAAAPTRDAKSAARHARTWASTGTGSAGTFRRSGAMRTCWCRWEAGIRPGIRPSGHTTANLCPYRHADKGKDRGKIPGQDGCAARDSNPEPAD
jgi:Phage integrase family